MVKSQQDIIVNNLFTMKISLEQLNELKDERFEDLCKALILKEIGPGSIIFGSGRDGGREATYSGEANYPSHTEKWNGKWIFQSKYCNTHGLVDDARSTIKGYIDSEPKSLEKYGYFKDGKCDYYIIITNVSFTGVAKKGTHDTIEEKIEKNLKKYPFKGFHYWDGVKVLSLLDANPDIKDEFFPPSNKKLAEKIDSGVQLLLDKIESIKDKPNKSSEIDAVIEQGKYLVDNYCCITAIKIFNMIKEKYWGETNEIQKYKILTSLGIGKLKCIQSEKDEGVVSEGANYLIDALDHNKEDEKALCNYAIGKQNLNNHDEAIRIAKIVLSKNEKSDIAYSIIVSSSQDNEDLNDVINKVPVQYREQPHTALAIGTVAIKKDSNDKAEEWLKKVLRGDNKKIIEGAKSLLASIYIEQAAKEKMASKISEDSKKKLLDAISMLSELWDIYSRTEMRNIRIHVFANRAFAKYLLGNIADGIKEYDIALEADPENENFIMNKANLVLHSENASLITEEIINSAKILHNKSGVSRATLLLIDLLMRSGIKKNKEEALRIAGNAIEDKVADLFVRKELLDKLLTMYLNDHRDKDAERIKNILKKDFPESIRTIINDAILTCTKEGISKGLPMLITAYSLSLKDPESNNFHILAETFFEYKIYDKAAKCYEHIVDIGKLDDRLDKMLLSLYQANYKSQLLTIMSTIRARHGLLKKYTLKESSLLFETGKKEEALNLIEQLIKVNERDLSLLLERATYLYGLERFDEVDKFLLAVIDFESLSKSEQLSLSSLYSKRKNFNQAIDIAYNLYRKNNKDLDVLNQIVGLFLLNNAEFDNYLVLDKVIYNTSVYVDWDGSEECYILEEKKGQTTISNEINADDDYEIIHELLGKRVNDDAKIGNVVGSKNLRKIKKISHKYIDAYYFAKKYLETKGYKDAKYVIGKIDENMTPEQFENTLKEAIDQLNDKGLLENKDEQDEDDDKIR